jgi:hypothetical protein
VNDADSKELIAFTTVTRALQDLDKELQSKVLDSVAVFLGVSGAHPRAASTTQGGNRGPSSNVHGTSSHHLQWTTFADLLDSAGPKTEKERVLVAGYWVQKHLPDGESDFPARMVTKWLKDAGYPVANVTVSFEQLKTERPALAVQTRKSGSSQQSQKRYKITDAGLRRVEEMASKASAVKE